MSRNVVLLAMMTIAVLPIAAQTNGALSFTSSSNEYVLVPYSDSLAPTGGITVECWMNASSFPSSPSIISKTEVGGYALYATSTTLWFDVRANGGYRSVSVNYSPYFGSWHHIAATFDGQLTKLYVDTTLVSQDIAHVINHYPIQYGYANPLIIGGEASTNGASGGNFFNGSLDEVRIWNYARIKDSIIAAQHRELQGTEPGLNGYWDFNEGSGTTAADKTSLHQNGTLFNTPTWIVSGVALPVELLSFSASTKNSSVTLRWTTAPEVNNHGFEVEQRAIENGQLTMDNWELIGFVEGNGNSNSPRNYSFEHKSVSSGHFAYRLKQIDRDGKFSYSQEVEAVVSATPKSFDLQQNYPNPFNPSTSIVFTLPERGYTLLKVYDVVGREVATLTNGVMDAGIHTVQFNGASFASGIYLYKLTSGSDVQIKRMTLLK